METISFSRLGKQDLRIGNGSFNLQLADGRVITMNEIDVAYFMGDSYTKATLPTAGQTGRLARVTDDARGLWFDQGSLWYQLSNHVANVKAFGAKGDGVTDDAAAFTAAINAADVVLVPDGTFILNSAVHTAMPSNKIIMGTGWRSILKRGDTYTGDLFTLATSATDIAFTNFQYNGNRTSTSPSGNRFIQGGAITRLVLDKIYGHDYTDKIVNLDGTNDFFRMVNSLFLNSFHRGVSSLAGSYGLIANNVFQNMNDSCIDVINFDHGIIANNVCHADGTVETANDAISVNSGNSLTIIGNRCYTTTARGIHVTKGDSSRTSGDTLLITGNTCLGAAATGGNGAIVVDQTYTGIIISNNATSGGRIRMINCSDAKISGNRLAGTSGYIDVEAVSSDCQDIVISDNHLDGPAGQAFDLVADPSPRVLRYVSVINNRVDDVSSSGSTDIGVRMRAGAGASVTDVWIEGNTILGATTRVSGGSNVYRRNNRWTTDATHGRATLVAGSATVTTSEVEASDNIHLTRVVTGGTEGTLSIGTITAGTSFVINSSSGSDTSTIFWEIVH